MARVALSRVARSCWLPSLGVHAASARPEGALWSGDTPSKSPPRPRSCSLSRVAARGPGSRVAPPPALLPRPPPRAGAPPAFRRGCGSRKRRAPSSALGHPTRPRRPADSARPPGGPQRRQRRVRSRVGVWDTSARTGWAAWTGHGDPGRASSGGPAGAPGLRSGRRGGGGHDLGVEAPAARGQAGGQVPVRGLLPRAGVGVHQEMVSGREAGGLLRTGTSSSPLSLRGFCPPAQ